MKILIVDDNLSFVEILKQYFSELNVMDSILTAFDGNGAVEAIAAHEPDVIIMDIFMPGLDGLGVLRKIKTLKLGRKPMIIILSAAGQSKIIQMALNLGADFFMIKPVDVQELAARIQELRAIKSQDEISRGSSAKASHAERSIEKLVMGILDELGVPSKLLGYKYLLSAIVLLLNDLTLINSVTKNLYSELAVQWKTTPQRIERAIRNAIEITWLRGNLENISDMFDQCKFTNKIRPSNSEFMIKIINECWRRSLIQ